MTKIRPIRSDTDYQAAVARVEELLDVTEELEVWLILVADYERKMQPVNTTALEALKFRMEQGGLRPVDLVPYIGSRAKVSEVLSGKRQLSLAMRQRLLDLGIPAVALLR